MSVPRSFKDRICQFLGVPYVGDVFCVVADRADNYYKHLTKMGITLSSIFTDFQTAENMMTTDSGDVLVLFPGQHTVTSSTTWDKDVTYIVGAGPKYQAYQPSTLTNGGTRLTCTTAAVSEIINITGHYVTLKGFGTQNTVSSTTSYGDIRVSGKNTVLDEMSLRGGNGANQLANIGVGVPLIVDTSVAGAGNALLVQNSVIGSSGNSARTKGPGCVQFVGGTANTGFGMHFKNNTFSTRIETASNNSVGLIQLLTAGSSADREILFENCGFYNFWENLASALTYCFRDACTTTHQIILQNCWGNKGITNWTDATTYLSSSTAAPNAAGGIGVNS
jgi:hypothetical protein